MIFCTQNRRTSHQREGIFWHKPFRALHHVDQMCNYSNDSTVTATAAAATAADTDTDTDAHKIMKRFIILIINTWHWLALA